MSLPVYWMVNSFSWGDGMGLQVESVAVPGIIPAQENRVDGPDVASIYIPGPAGIGVLRAAARAEAAAEVVISSAVRFDAAQALTDGQKSQARANIKTIQFVDAATSADVPEISGQALIRIAADENNGGFTTLYFQDGVARSWIPMVSV